MASGISYFTLLITFFSLHYLPAFSQQRKHTRLSLKSSTLSVQTTLSQKNSNLFSTNFFGLDVKIKQRISNLEIIKALLADPCSTGGQGGEVINPNGNDDVSPDSKVHDPGQAVDGDLSTYSELHIAVQQKDVEVIQKITFSTTTNTTDAVKLTLSLGETLLNYKVTAQAYYNDTPVGTLTDITSSLPLHPTTIDYSFVPGVIFNQVRIGVTALQNGNHRARIYLHEVSLTLTSPPPPSGGSGAGGSGSSGTTSSIWACEDNVVLSVSSPSSDVVYKWYDSSNAYLASGSTYSPASLSAGDYIYYVSASRCAVESAKDQINLTVYPKPNTPIIQSNN